MKVVISRGFICLFRFQNMRWGFEKRIAEMAAWRRAIELSLTDTDTTKLRLIAQSRTEPASRVERARMLLAYREAPRFLPWAERSDCITRPCSEDGGTPFAPRCLKDVVEERLFAHRRDLLTRLDLVFMDTTSLYFEGAGGQTLGRHGYSKDHRPDLRQMILAVLIDGAGRPVCSEMWPGNTADVTTLIPVIDRLRRRFDIARVCVVADRGMISAETVAELEARRLLYILGVRERTDKLVRELVLDDPAPFVPLAMKKRGKEIDYEAKTVTLAGRRYIVCRNHQEAEKDAADRASIVAALERQLAKGDKALVGNTGFRRYLKTISDEHFAIDPDKIEEEKKFDGIFVLRTNTDLNPLEAMLCYKQLWTVEQTFRTAKHLLLHPADLPQARRDHPRSRVLQLPRAGAEDGAGGPHRRARSLRLLARDHRRSGFADRDRDRARRQALHRPLRAASRRQPGLACRRRRAAADRPRGRRLLTPPIRKCSAKPPARRGLQLPISYLVNRTVEDGPQGPQHSGTLAEIACRPRSGACCGRPGNRTMPTKPRSCFATSRDASKEIGLGSPARSWKASKKSSPSPGSDCRTNYANRLPVPT